MPCFSSTGIARKESSVPASCSVSDLEFLNILYISEKKRKPLVKDIKKKICIPTVYSNSSKT